MNSDEALNTCGCCEEGADPSVHNRPGLSSLVYRAGTHGVFLRRMLRRLPQEDIPDGPNQGSRPLAELTVRSAQDPAIGFLDAWASIADILTFYQERIANEGYLRTATELRSVLELARAIGYELNPGVAASAHLAFTVEEAPGAPTEAVVPARARVLSVPGPGELPQPFETTEAITARVEWNAMRPRPTSPASLVRGQEFIYLKGVTTQLQPGDALLIVGDDREQFPGSERWDFRIVQTVTVNPRRDYTLVTWDPGVGHENPTVDPADNPRVYVFRQRAALFGYNAPDWRTMPDSTKQAFDPNYNPNNPDARRTQWPDFEIQGDVIDLNAVFPKVLPGSWVILEKPSYVEVYRAVEVDTDSRTDFSLTSQVTRIHPDGTEHLTWFPLRDTVAFVQSEELPLAEVPIDDPVQGDVIELDRVVPPPDKGQSLILTGRRARALVAVGTAVDLTSLDGSQTVTLPAGSSSVVLERPTISDDGAETWHLRTGSGFEGLATESPGALFLQPARDDDGLASEVAIVETVGNGLERTTIELEDPLLGIYDRSTVTLSANVAPATHGETAQEVLGSGDGSVPNQRFTLKKPPLTHVSAATASGAASTLELRVDGVLWQEAPSLYRRAPSSQSYAIRRDASGGSTVIFGDGKSGSRVPTGQENITALYRSGIGPDGEVAAGSLMLMAARPLGIRSVTNPLAASGAASPETVDGARASSPVTVLTLDRIVSLQDFENFARAFAGIGKAKASVLWDGLGSLVHLTIAGEGGEEVRADSSLYHNLLSALDGARDIRQRVVVQTFEALQFGVDARVLVDPRYVAEEVLIAVKGALEAAFAFEPRGFGQPVTGAEVMTVIQQVAGVTAVDIDRVHVIGGGSGSGPTAVLTASTARREGDAFRAAQLLRIDPAGISLQEMLQ